MKSLHLISRLYPQYQGGTEIHVASLCKQLALSREEVVIFTTQQSKSEKNYTLTRKESQSLIIYTLIIPEIHSKLQLFYQMFFKSIRICQIYIQILKQEKPQLIHFHHLLNLSSLLLPLTWILRKPYCLDLVDYWYLCPNIMLTCGGSLDRCATYCLWQNPGNIVDTIIRRITLPADSQPSLKKGGEGIKTWVRDFYGYLRVMWHRMVWQLLLNFPQGLLLPISKRTAAIYSKLYISARRMRVKPCGIEPLKVAINSGKKDSLVIGFVGTLMPEKGVAILIEAFKKLSGSNLSLHLYGHSRYSQTQLQTWQQEDSRIRYFGEFDHQDLAKILASIDILTVPSLVEETYSLITNEGLMAKIPVIVSSIGAMKERIVEEKNGFLVEPGNSEDLTKKLAFVIKHFNSIKRRLNFSLNQYTIEEEVKQVKEIYHSQLGLLRV